MTDDVPNPGDYTTVTVGRQPLVVVRGQGGQLQAFHNLCRHRGATLLEGRGNVQRGISCFYHRWRYDVDGHLTTVPQPEQFPGLCKDDWGLKPASVDSWNGILFVHVDPEPDQGLDAWLDAFPDRMSGYQPLELAEVRTVRHEIKANWKLFLENHVDGYHLWHLHAKSIKGLAHPRQDWAATGRHWNFYEPSTDPGSYADQKMTGLPLIPTVPSDGFGSTVHLLFPNLALAGGATFWATIHVVPLAPDRTAIELRTRIAPIRTPRHAGRMATIGVRELAKTVSRSPLGGALRSLHLMAAEDIADGVDFVAEDIRAAESLQRAIASPRFEVGPMATDYENAITFFHQNILDYTDPAP
jgi:Rieske 2Fe-2S family protein